MPMLEAFARSRVLVVDDNEPSARLIHRLLTRAGLPEVDVVIDPRQALSRIEQRHTDLLVLDLHMPHIDGSTLLADVRRSASPSDLPVLVLTADTTREAARRALSLGANDFVTKPLDLTEMTLRVRNLLETRTLHAGLRRRQQWVEASAALARDLLPGCVGSPLDLVAVTAGAIADADLAFVIAADDPPPEAVQVLSGGPLLVADVRDRGFVPATGHGADLGPAMLLPLVSAQGAHGLLVLARRRGRAPYDSSDLEMATGFAGQAALALELSAARADQEWMAVLEDRHRIARDLHDHVIQRLFATGLRLQSIASAVAPGDTADRINERVADLDDTIMQIRSSIFQLRTEGVSAGGRSVSARITGGAAD